MNFLLDENISPSLADILIQQGHHAVHLKSVNLLGKPDEIIFDYAFSEDFILITHDLDFSRIHAYSGKSKPSVILFRMEFFTIKMMADILSIYLKDLETDLINGAFVVIEEGQIRIRQLPIH